MPAHSLQERPKSGNGHWGNRKSAGILTGRRRSIRSGRKNRAAGTVGWFNPGFDGLRNETCDSSPGIRAACSGLSDTIRRPVRCPPGRTILSGWPQSTGLSTQFHPQECWNSWHMDQLSQNRLPPGQQLIADQRWPVVGENAPREDATPWTIRVAGLVFDPREWTLAELLQQCRRLNALSTSTA